MRNKGFTLIELMIVVVIIGILAAIAIPNFMRMRDRAREASTEANMHTLQLNAEEFSTLADGAYPSGTETTVSQVLGALNYTNVDSKLSALCDKASPCKPDYGPNAMVPNAMKNPFKPPDWAVDQAAVSLAGCIYYYSFDVTGTHAAGGYSIRGGDRLGQALLLVLGSGQ